MLTMLSALLVWLAVLSGTTQSTTAYYMEFENVIGLSPGGQILFEGYPVGEIDDIVFTRSPDASVYRLNVNIRKNWGIPEDSIAVMTQASLLSAVVVDIQAGSSNQMLAPDSRIPSLGSSNIMTAMASVAAKLGATLPTRTCSPYLKISQEGQAHSKPSPKMPPSFWIMSKSLRSS